MVQSILVEANLFLAIKLQPDIIIRAIRRLYFKNKIKVEKGPKSLLQCDSRINRPTVTKKICK